MKKVMQKDAARTEDVVPYNIIPLDSLTSTTNAIVNFLEVIVQSKVFFYCQFAGSGGGYIHMNCFNSGEGSNINSAVP
jgi:hypothetical protein